MAAGFDPYHRWLSIPPSEQPPNHYRLLGLQAFESSIEVIENAAARQSAHVRHHLQAPLRPYAVNLIREIEVARLCLLDEEAKTGYDAWLRNRLDDANSQVAPNLSQARSQAIAFQTQPVGTWPSIGQQSTQDSINPAIVTASRSHRARRKRSPIAFMFLWLAGGVMGLLAGYAILCMIDPQYDFLNVVFDNELASVDATNQAANPSPGPKVPGLRPASQARSTGDRARRRIPSTQIGRPQNKIVESTTTVRDAKGTSKLSDVGAPRIEREKDAPLKSDLKPVLVPFDLKKRVLRVVATPGEPLSPNLVCDVHGSGELDFAPLFNLPLGEKQTILFRSQVQDVTVGAEVEFIQRNDIVVVEIRPKYRLPSGDEEAMYKAVGLRKIKLLSNQVSVATNAQRSLPTMRSTLGRIRTEYQAVLPKANSASTGMGYLQITAAQLRAGALAKQAAGLENQIRDAETIAANLPRLQSDLAAVRALGEWSAQIATTATLTVNIHVDGIGLLAEAR